MKNHTPSLIRILLPAALTAIFLAASACALNPFYRQGPKHVDPSATKTDAKPVSVSSSSTRRPPDRTRCGLAPDPGRCRAAFQRYYFDTASGKCKVFIWGGCGGTVPFKSLKECKADCEF